MDVHRQLRDAVEAGREGDARRLLDEGAHANSRSGDPLLYLATKNGHPDIIRLLLEKGAAVDAKCMFLRYTALHEATKKNRVDLARLLLQHGADPNATNTYGRTPLYAAASVEMARLLVENGAEVNRIDDGVRRNPLCGAAAHDRVDVARFLLENGADCNAKSSDGVTPLHVAASAGNAAVVELLLKHGVIVDARDSAGRTPLYSASTTELDAARLLLRNGADANTKTTDGRTPLLGAVTQSCAQGNEFSTSSGPAAFARLLLQNGADITATDQDGRSALALAIESNGLERRNLFGIKDALCTADIQEALCRVQTLCEFGSTWDEACARDAERDAAWFRRAGRVVSRAAGMLNETSEMKQVLRRCARHWIGQRSTSSKSNSRLVDVDSELVMKILNGEGTLRSLKLYLQSLS